MKRVIKSIIALAIIFFIFQLVVTFFETKHEMVYSIAHDGKNYNVKEEFIKVQKNHYYSFQVVDEDNRKFIFYYNEDYNKQSKILYDLETYQENGLYCIMPVFKDRQNGSIVCNQNGELMSYDYLKQAGVSLENWYTALKAKKYKFDDSGDEVASQENVMLYNHFPEDYKVTLWNYHGLYIVNRDHIKDLEILASDHYENTLGIQVGKYYIIANTDQDYTYNSFYIVDLFSESKELIETDVEISQNSYFLGAIDNEIYILDRDKKIEYTFNMKTRKVKEIGNATSNAKVYNNGQFETKDINVVSNNRETFNMNIPVQELENRYHPKQIQESENKYFFVTNDNKVYYVMKNSLEDKVLLFQDGNLQDLKVIEDNLFFISGQDIIWYSMESGYHKIVTHPELLYNNKNIFNVLKK